MGDKDRYLVCNLRTSNLGIPYRVEVMLVWEVWQSAGVQPIGVPYPLKCCQSLGSGLFH